MTKKNTSISYRIIFYSISLIFISSVPFINYSCKNNPETPADDLPGRRDYTWTVDTLKVPEGASIPSWIWGTSADDIWAAGMAYLNECCLWHYDGNKWKNYDPGMYFDPRGIFGFSSNNIWLGSTDGAFWHYDGSRWSKFCQTSIPGYQSFVAQGMSGDSPNNIYSVGFADSIDGNSYKAVIMHFDGNEWKQVNIPIIRNSFVQILYDQNSSLYLIYAWIFNKPDQIVYTFDGKRLQVIFTNQEVISLAKIGKSIYASVNDKLYKYNGANFILFKDFASNNCAVTIGGRSEKDIFTYNYDGLGQYNGSDLITIYKKWNNDWSHSGFIAFNNDIFSIWEDNFNTYIIHGKLK